LLGGGASFGYVVRVLWVSNLPPAGAVFFSTNFVRGVGEPKFLSLLKKVPIVFVVNFKEFDAVPLVCFVVFDIVANACGFFFVKDDSS
jgi:hypothetical protein